MQILTLVLFLSKKKVAAVFSKSTYNFEIKLTQTQLVPFCLSTSCFECFEFILIQSKGYDTLFLIKDWWRYFTFYAPIYTYNKQLL